MKSELVPKSILRVFISSAQRDEGAFNWEDARKRIADELRKCPFFIPFVMEESGSELSPVQRFLFRVEQSDIVILLVKADVREGTALEVATAMKKKKPILVFFLNDDTNHLFKQKSTIYSL